ncbi:hypothetical protein TNCV_1404781 [Trichonephila clavipes]|nr:hypothetical protein TNCV_1404781 [Trichonephila clavipes]
MGQTQFSKSVIAVDFDALYNRTGTLLCFKCHKSSTKAFPNSRFPLKRYAGNRRIDIDTQCALVSVRKPFISARNAKIRLQWDRKRSNLLSEDWKRVMWSDELLNILFCHVGRR